MIQGVDVKFLTLFLGLIVLSSYQLSFAEECRFFPLDKTIEFDDKVWEEDEDGKFSSLASELRSLASPFVIVELLFSYAIDLKDCSKKDKEKTIALFRKNSHQLFNILKGYFGAMESANEVLIGGVPVSLRIDGTIMVFESRFNFFPLEINRPAYRAQFIVPDSASGSQTVLQLSNVIKEASFVID